ncbi:MAG: hypothetical protein GEU90_18375 [Gemmatimonas sp.]|nr:hypothetical protein [Gemmatimonas sp.]
MRNDDCNRHLNWRSRAIVTYAEYFQKRSELTMKDQLRPLLPLIAAGVVGCASASAPTPGPQTAVPPPTGSFEVLGRGPITETHASDLWVFEGVDGRDYAYVGTWGACDGCYGDRMYAWDVTNPQDPVLTDSVVVDARVVNDVKVNEAGTVAVITREGASNRRNGIVLLDLSEPAHPTVASEYWETLTGGVHNTFIDGDFVYAVHNGTADLHIIDISNLKAPAEIGRWGIPIHPAKYLHDVWVEDGLAYVSYWDDGLVILDVGNGIEGGTPEEPVFVSQYRYQTSFQGDDYGNTHTAVPYTNAAGNRYIFVGDEIFPEGFDVEQRDQHPGGYVHVVDISDLQNPVEVAKYEVPGAGVHNLWLEDDILYAAYYNAGLRAVDVSGDLQGDLRLQDREIAVLLTEDEDAFIETRTFTWGPQLYKGTVFASDHNSGLWVARLPPNAKPPVRTEGVGNNGS